MCCWDYNEFNFLNGSNKGCKTEFSTFLTGFDLFNVAETNSLVSVTTTHVQLSYVDEQGQVIQLRKALPDNPLNVQVGSKLISSSVEDEHGGGFLESTNTESGNNVVGKSLAAVNWDAIDTSKLQTKVFTDGNGLQ
jgi:hypothetical protein